MPLEMIIRGPLTAFLVPFTDLLKILHCPNCKGFCPAYRGYKGYEGFKASVMGFCPDQGHLPCLQGARNGYEGFKAGLKVS